jgi:SAM-dependent methyltransferase
MALALAARFICGTEGAREGLPLFRDTQAYYDAMYSWKDYAAEAKAVDAIVRRAKRSQGATLLDVACGTGAHLGHLRKRYKVEGVDLDAGMLLVARKRLRGVKFHLGDMRRFDLGRQFDAVVCLFSAIGYARTVTGLNQALERLAAHTKPGGVVVVEPWITPAAFRAGRSGVQVGESGGVKVARAFKTSRQGRISLLEFDYLIAEGGRLHKVHERHELGLFSRAEYERAFRRAGLGVRLYKRGLTGRGLFVGTKPLR